MYRELIQPTEFIAAIRTAACEKKRDWICSLVKSKEVLDLGVVAHSLDCCLKHRHTWLHGLIRDHAAFVLGVDILKEEVRILQELGYNVILADALSLRLDRQFDVVVCGDLIEHVSNPGALLETIHYHLRDEGVAVVSTPNPMAVSRFFNIVADGWTGINTEHVSWFCPQTMFQLIKRSQLFIDDFVWLETDFTMPTNRRLFGAFLNWLAPRIAGRKQLLRNDYGVLLRRKVPRLRKDESEVPFVSVILPTFNRGKLFENAFHSLANQDYPGSRFEIIVVDNGSSDDTPQRMRRIAEETYGKVNVKYVREERPGLVFARHTGAVHAKGEILLFGDDDALFDKNLISAVVEVFNGSPEVGAVGTRISVLWDHEPEAWVRRHEQSLGKLDYGDQIVIRRGLNINGGSFAIRKTVLGMVYGFNPGQLGGYLVGDSETGLCRKLAQQDVLVAWTPASTMWHLQRAAINGTIGDLKRRLRNEGISDAYGASFYGWSIPQLLSDIYSKTRQVLAKCRNSAREGGWAYLRRDLILEMEYYRYYLKYLWLYRFNSTVRGEVKKRDWTLTPSYKVPPIILATKYGQLRALHD